MRSDCHRRKNPPLSILRAVRVATGRGEKAGNLKTVELSEKSGKTTRRYLKVRDWCFGQEKVRKIDMELDVATLVVYLTHGALGGGIL